MTHPGTYPISFPGLIIKTRPSRNTISYKCGSPGTAGHRRQWALGPGPAGEEDTGGLCPFAVSTGCPRLGKPQEASRTVAEGGQRPGMLQESCFPLLCGKSLPANSQEQQFFKTRRKPLNGQLPSLPLRARGPGGGVFPRPHLGPAGAPSGAAGEGGGRRVGAGVGLTAPPARPHLSTRRPPQGRRRPRIGAPIPRGRPAHRRPPPACRPGPRPAPLPYLFFKLLHFFSLISCRVLHFPPPVSL